ncbi:MAG: hypothetical protein Q4P34_05580 [Tissierellia bacterium]|nr:hypothetical protein [Tissierellia bacterium]
MDLRLWSIIMFVGFLILMGALAVKAGKSNLEGEGNLDEEYYLGGRGTGPILLAFSYVTGSVSAAAFMGEPGMMSQIGWPYYWIVISIIPGMIFPAILLMKKLREHSEELGSLTIPQYLGQTYESDALRVIIAVFISVFYIFPLVAQFKGAAILLEQFTNIPFVWGVLIFTGLIAVYCATGGLRSAIWTSVIQGIPMFFIAIALVWLSLKVVGGFNGIEQTLSNSHPEMLNIVQERAPGAMFPIEGVIGVFAYWLIMFIAQPYLCSRFMSIKDTKPKTIGIFLITTLVLTIVYNTLYLSGLAGRIIYPGIEGDYITSQLAIDYLPTFFAAFMMIGIFGAMMSTTQSMILVIAQAIANDIYLKTINPNASDKKVVNLTRIAIFVVSGICFALTVMKTPEFLSVFFYLGLSGIGACIAVPLIAAILWPKARKQGAIAAAIVGPISYTVFNNLMDINLWFSSFLAVIISGILLISISLYMNKKGFQEKLSESLE